MEYQKFKEAANRLGHLEASQKEIFTRPFQKYSEVDEEGETYFETGIFDLLSAFSKILQRMPKKMLYEIVKDEFTVEGKVHEIFHLLVTEPVLYFSKLFEKAKNRLEVVATFLAILELIRLQEILVRQKTVFGEVEILRNKDKIESGVREGETQA